MLTAGCGQKPAAPSTTVVVRTMPTTPSEIELSEAKVTLLEPTKASIEVKYRFTKGQPNQCYSLDITFPGTSNQGIRRMDGWELKKEGVIRDQVMLREPGAKSFEVTMSETPSPQLGYKKVSNVVSGQIQ
jgi:hypothetical protein